MKHKWFVTVMNFLKPSWINRQSMQVTSVLMLLTGVAIAVLPAPVVAATVSANSEAVPAAKQTREEVGAIKLARVTPSQVFERKGPQRLTLKGQGFSKRSLVALSRAGKVSVLPADKVEYVNDRTLVVEVSTEGLIGEWAARIGSEDKRYSNVLYFKVVDRENPSLSQNRKSASAQDEATKPTTTIPAGGPTHPIAKKKNARNVEKILGNEWLSRQPKQNYTLQLLVSSSRYNLTLFTRKHQDLTGPLASYAFNKDGSQFHALTMGSYASREKAMQAASRLPDGVKGWPRILASVQQLMLPESSPLQDTARSKSTNAQVAQDKYKDTAWAWSQDPTHYTVQLAGGRDEKLLEAAMYQDSLPHELAVVLSTRKGRIWYVLIYGSFASRDAADAAIQQLPEKLKRGKPWARRFAIIQSEMSSSTPH